MMNTSEILHALQEAERIHPVDSLLFPEGKSKAKWLQIATNPEYSDMLSELKEAAENYLAVPIRTLPYSLFKLYDSTGSRKEFEAEYFDRRGRLNTFAILSMAYDDRFYIEALEDILWAVCDEYSWCLPAHFVSGGTSIVDRLNRDIPADGHIYATYRQHETNLDLFATETGFALAEVLYLLEDRLAPPVVYRVRQELSKRILKSFREINSCYFWETAVHNWAAVCAGSVGAVFLYMVREASVLAPILKRLLESLECFLESYGEDGICTEGLGYWNYGFGYFVFFAEMLRQRSGGKIDLLAEKKIENIALFQQKCYLSGNSVVSFSDSSRTYHYSPGLTSFLKSRFPDVDVPDARFKAGFYQDSCHRWASRVRDFVWSVPPEGDKVLQDMSYYTGETQWLISRKRIGNHVVCLAAKGGHNAEAHNHNDVGSFIFHVNGASLLTDIGAGEYTREYFGPDRYQFLCNGSQGHSVPVIDGGTQQNGRERAAEILAHGIAEECDFLEMDISKAYAVEHLTGLVRRFTFLKSDPIKLGITDTYHFTGQPASVVERFVSFAEPVLMPEGCIRLSGINSGIDIRYPEDQLTVYVEKQLFNEHDSSTKEVYLIDLQVKPHCMKDVFSVAIDVEPYFD